MISIQQDLTAGKTLISMPLLPNNFVDTPMREAAAAVKHPVGYIDNLSKVAFSERRDPFLSRTLHCLYNQIAYAKLEGNSISAITTLTPGSAKTLFRASHFRTAKQFEVCSLAGPILELTWDSEGTHSEKILPIGLANICAVLADSDYFWIPEPHLAMLMLGSESTLTALCRRSRYGVIITLPIQSDSIYKDVSVCGLPSKQEYEQWLQFPRITDHDARLSLHSSGFNFVSRFAVHDLTQKISEYNEMHGLTIIQMPMLCTDHSKVAYETLFATPRANCIY